MDIWTLYFFLSFTILANCEDDAIVTRKVQLDIQIGNEKAGTIELGLFGNIAPKTVTNFVALAGHEVFSCAFYTCNLL